MSVRRVLLPVALTVAALWPAAIPAAAQDPTPPAECPETSSFDQVPETGSGIGWTVPRGTEPQPFAVEIVGKFPDGIRPGFDIILVRVSDWPGQDFIANAGGIHGGMSGSPVYIDDKLIGAVAWGFSLGPSRLGGVTPIDSMQRIDADVDPSQTRLSRRLRQALRQAAPASVELSDFGQLPIPMLLQDTRTRGPRGGTPRKRAAIRERFDLPRRLADRGVEIIPTNRAGRSRTARPAAVGLVPGGNLGAALSFGALSAVGFGTTTLVCGDRVLGFGHEFFLTGASNMGVYDARTLDVVDDPTLTPFKLAVPLEPLLGKVVRDRGAGIAARLDRMPQELLVTTQTGRDAASMPGVLTEIYAQTPRFLLSILPADHAFFELLRVIDAFEDGSVGVGLTVEGRREDGSPFTVRFGDRWIGAERPGEEFFNSIEAGTFGVGLMLGWLLDNPYDRVTLESADIELDLGGANRWVITDIAVSRSGEGGPFETGSPVCVARGDDLTVRVTLESEPGLGEDEVMLEIGVPRRFATLRVLGGRGLDPFLDPGSFDGFDGLLAHLRRTPRSDEAIVRILRNGIKQASEKELLDRVVVGRASVALAPIGSPGC